MRQLRNLITYANVAASLALLLSLGGTAYAAVVITGKNVKDSSLTGADVQNGSLASKDLSAAARASFKGARGSQGPAGPMGISGFDGARGTTGATGPQGDTGANGEPAAVVTSFASRDTGLLMRSSLDVPNPQSRAWYDYNCGGSTGDPMSDPACASDNGNQAPSGVGNIPLIAAPTMVLALQGMSRSADETRHEITSNNNVEVPWSNNLSGTASVVLLHNGPVGTTQSIHDRVECALQYANSTSPSTFSNLGEPQMVSSFGTKEVVSLTLIGSKNLSAGTYNVRVTCSELDNNDTSEYGWRFVRGNLVAMAARNG